MSALGWLLFDDFKWNFSDSVDITAASKDSKLTGWNLIKLRTLCWEIPVAIFWVVSHHQVSPPPVLCVCHRSTWLPTHASHQDIHHHGLLLSHVVVYFDPAKRRETSCYCSTLVSCSSCCCVLTWYPCIHIQSCTTTWEEGCSSCSASSSSADSFRVWSKHTLMTTTSNVSSSLMVKAI